MFRCIYSKEEHERSDGEHIIQNFLGARRVSKTIVCDRLQREFGQGIDLDMERVLQVIRNLLGTKGGRRGVGPTLRQLPTAGGRTVNVLPGGFALPSAPLIEEFDLADGKKHVKIKATSPEHIEWALAQVKAKYPKTEIDQEALLDAAVVTEEYIDDPVQHKLELGGPELFRGLLKACFNLLGEEHLDKVFMSCFDPVRNYIRDGGEAAEFIRWYASDDLPALPRLGQADQQIYIVSRGHSVEGVAILFGALIYPFRLTSTYQGEPFSSVYLVDPFRQSQPAELKNPNFNADAVPVFMEQADDISEAVLNANRKAIERVMILYQARAREATTRRTVEEVLAKHGSGSVTKEIVAELADVLVKRMMRVKREIGPYRKVGIHNRKK